MVSRSPHIERDGCSLPVDQAAATTSLLGLSQGALAAQPLQRPLVLSRDAEAYCASLPLLDTSWVNTDQDGICRRVCFLLWLGLCLHMCWTAIDVLGASIFLCVPRTLEHGLQGNRRVNDTCCDCNFLLHELMHSKLKIYSICTCTFLTGRCGTQKQDDINSASKRIRKC